MSEAPVININPTRIPGRWREGYALDVQTVSSVYIGDDEYGHPRYDTTRTPLGELLYRLKYGRDKGVIPELVSAASDFIRKWNPHIDVLVPTPASKARQEQPVLLVAEPLASSIAVAYVPNSITKAKEIPHLKDVRDFDQRLKLLAGAFSVKKTATAGKRVLLFDDLFRSGATMGTLAALLYDEGEATDVYALTLTRTRSNR